MFSGFLGFSIPHLFSRARNKRIFLFFLWGDPVQNRPQNPDPADGLLSTRKSTFVKGELLKFVANCAPNLRISFCASEEGCAKLSQICRKLEIKFGQFSLFPCPLLRISEKMISETNFWVYVIFFCADSACIRCSFP